MGSKSSVTNLFKYKIAQFMCNSIIASDANTYVTIGRPLYWGPDATELQSEVSDIIGSKNYIDDSRRNFIAMKRVEFSDLALVVPRLDWRSGIVYDQYNDHIDIFSHDRQTDIGLVFANSNFTIPGTVNVSTSTAVYGANTEFNSLVLVGDQITINNQTRTVSSITNNTFLSVSSAFTTTGNGNTMVILANNRVARNSAGVFSGNVDQGTIVTIGDNTKEVIEVRSSKLIITNTKFTYSYSGNASAITLVNKYPLYANNFYVRNSRDQVFKCLYTPRVGASYVASTVEPTIDIDGQLPEDPYIETGDFYKWKYLYTIPYGLKQKFFTKDWMPVVTDRSSSEAAVDGRIDIIDITNSGNQYFSLTGTGNNSSYPILSVTGDGVGANVTAQVEFGRIVEVNILDGGSGYTKANVVVSANSDQLGGNTNTANVATFDVVIGPQGGHAFNPAKELGCYSFMISAELSGTENNKVPVSGSEWGGAFDFRQITLLRDPEYANGVLASASVYRASTKVSVATPASPFQTDETVFIGSTLSEATFTATVAAWDVSNNELLLIDIDGSITSTSEIKGNSSGAKSAILSVEDPEVNVFSGDVLYIENRLPIIRNTSQSEQIRIVLSF